MPVQNRPLLKIKTEDSARKRAAALKSTMLPEVLPDLEATFRNKAGRKEHRRGYAANLEESVGANDSFVTDYQYEQNNQSDSQFSRNT